MANGHHGDRGIRAALPVVLGLDHVFESVLILLLKMAEKTAWGLEPSMETVTLENVRILMLFS